MSTPSRFPRSIPLAARRGALVLLVVAGLAAGFVALALPGALVAQGVDDEARGAAGVWSGSIEVPGAPVGIQVTLTPPTAGDGDEGGSGWSGTIDIPAQSARGLQLVDVSVGGAVEDGAVEDGTAEGDGPAGLPVRFRIDGVPGAPTFDGRLEGDTIAGAFTQGGAQLSFSLTRGELAPVTRPQDPKPPFPYRSEEVTFEHDGLTFAGTLTLPEASSPTSPVPGVVLLTGSGPQNRDEEIFEHRPFAVLADHLTRQGIAVLRFDDRGVGGSGGTVSTSTLEDFTGDALAALAALAARPEVDAARSGLLGHSEGANVAAAAAVRPPAEGATRPAFIVQLAGTSVPGHEILPAQTRAMILAAGADEATADAQAASLQKILDAVRAGAAPEELRETVRTVVESQAPGLDEAELEPILDAELSRLQGAWMEHFLEYDPSRPLVTLAREHPEIPVLYLVGSLDRQVLPEQNLPPVRAALEDHPDAAIEELPGLNHLFQTATTGSTAEYAGIEETMSPTVLERVAGWILERFGETE